MGSFPFGQFVQTGPTQGPYTYDQWTNQYGQDAGLIASSGWTPEMVQREQQGLDPYTGLPGYAPALTQSSVYSMYAPGQTPTDAPPPLAAYGSPQPPATPPGVAQQPIMGAPIMASGAQPQLASSNPYSLLSGQSASMQPAPVAGGIVGGAPGVPQVPSVTGGRPTGSGAPPTGGAPPMGGGTPPPAGGSSGGIFTGGEYGQQQPYNFQMPTYGGQGGGYTPNFASPDGFGGGAPVGQLPQWSPNWNTQMPQQGPQQQYPGFSGANAWLADQTNDIGYLRGMTENAGYATDATPAWEQMVAAQQRNIERQKAELGARFNASGNRFSTSYGDAMADFTNQSVLDQNSLLGQMTLQSQEAARGRELQAAGQLGGMAGAAGQQLSGQDYGMQQQQLQAALQAAMAASGGADQASQALAGYGAQGALGLLGTSMDAAKAMYGGELGAAQSLWGAGNDAAGAMYNGQMGLLPQMMQYDLGLRGQGTQAAGDLSRLWQGNLGLGSAMGEQQWNMDTDNLNRTYQEWIRTQPMYNPMIPYFYQTATQQPMMYNPAFQPSTFSQVATPIAELMKGFGAMYGGIKGG